jgi:hypothetical protein
MYAGAIPSGRLARSEFRHQLLRGLMDCMAAFDADEQGPWFMDDEALAFATRHE